MPQVPHAASVVMVMLGYVPGRDTMPTSRPSPTVLAPFSRLRFGLALQLVRGPP